MCFWDLKNTSWAKIFFFGSTDVFCCDVAVFQRSRAYKAIKNVWACFQKKSFDIFNKASLKCWSVDYLSQNKQRIFLLFGLRLFYLDGLAFLRSRGPLTTISITACFRRKKQKKLTKHRTVCNPNPELAPVTMYVLCFKSKSATTWSHVEKRDVRNKLDMCFGRYLWKMRNHPF